MGYKETYNARVAMQESLDELFPKGAYVTTVTEVDRRVQPTGVELVTARPFCSDAVDDGISHRYQIFVDPRQQELAAGEWQQPITFWVAELDTEDEMITADILNDAGEPVGNQLRMRADALVGDRRVLSGAREFITALRETEFFPTGITEIVREPA